MYELLGIGSFFIESGLPFLFFAVPLAVGAYYDYYRQMKVPDLVPSIMWILASFVLLYNAFAYLVLPLSFAALFFVASLAAWFDKEILGWSDILALPPLCCMVFLLFLEGGGYLVLILLPVAYLAASWRSGMKKEVPFYPYMLIAYTLGIILSA
jgi:hypothetical protein